MHLWLKKKKKKKILVFYFLFFYVKIIKVLGVLKDEEGKEAEFSYSAFIFFLFFFVANFFVVVACIPVRSCADNYLHFPCCVMIGEGMI